MAVAETEGGSVVHVRGRVRGGGHSGVPSCVAAAAAGRADRLKALVWFWLIDGTLSANLVYQSDYEIASTTPSDETMVRIMMMVMAW